MLIKLILASETERIYLISGMNLYSIAVDTLLFGKKKKRKRKTHLKVSNNFTCDQSTIPSNREFPNCVGRYGYATNC